MKIFVLGTEQDVRGFALAGVDGRIGDVADSTRRFLERAAEGGQDVGLLLLSEAIARQALGQVDQLVVKGCPPAVLILPETGR